MNRLLICLLPPFWLKLPPLSLSYLAASLKNQDENNSDIFIDFNSEIYQKLKTQYPQDFLIKNWESNNQNHKQFFFENLIERYPKFIDDLIDKIKKNEITHIAFSVFESNYYTTMKTIENLKKQCQNIIIIVGGPEITKILTLNKKKEIQADIWAVGEGENAIISIKNGSAKSQYYFEEIKNIDDLAYPDFTIFNLNNYKVNNCLPILMSRGCINNCSFCSEKKLYKNFKFRQHSSEYTIEMLKYLNKKFNINWFIFQDSLINANLEKLEKLCILMIDKLPNMKWEAQIYIRNDMPIELFKL
ncbi:MAG TPA: cobalamin-dependent protein, partial [bacterium]|nr:cobalamin-dependent protein [bacterium]